MKSFTASTNDAGQRLDKFITKVCPALPTAQLYKYIRLKRVKVNGKKSEISYKLTQGDLIELYINDEFFEKADSATAFLALTPKLDIVYEDEHILLLNKRPGVVVHEDDDGTVDTLINNIKAYLFQKGHWNPQDSGSFTPALCNRIDRNTGGIVIAAKTAPALRILNEQIKQHHLEKAYLCLAHGKFEKPKGTVKNFLWKDEKQNKVLAFSSPRPGAKTAITHYRVVEYKKGFSLVECTLETGRTHQIRVHMQGLGHPLVGDTKYGTAKQNRELPFQGQCLYSYRLTLLPTGDWGELSYLAGKTFAIEHIYFLDFFKKLSN